MMFWKKKLRVFQIASMARSGETLLQKHLSIHSKIHICHNLFEHDTPEEQRLFNFLRLREERWIDARDPAAEHLRAKRGDIIVIKQGVWRHAYPFDGFVFSRHPVSIFSSLLSYDKSLPCNATTEERWAEIVPRLKRWEPDLFPRADIDYVNDSPEEQFIKFYNCRGAQLSDLRLPIFQFEYFLKHPEQTLIEMCAIMGLNLEPGMLQAHKFFEGERSKGHGNSDLSRGISADANEKYKNVLSKSQIECITHGTSDVAKSLGYKGTD